MSDPREDADNLIVRTREAHEVLKEMKETERRINHAIKVAEDTKLKLIAEVVASVDNLIGTAVEVGLNNYVDTMMKAIEDAEASVQKRFDVLFETLLLDMSEALDKAISDRVSTPAVDTLQQVRKTIHNKILDIDP